ncbi:hypothetical protein [Abiotrophia defectiva]|uniref:hypothetical protein n=1 Tax=Abiotrophia defectiva TaxID=46125 RepID=UPI0028F01F54|nr:hypothetical protein [Abiotrophia defectiva]
MKWFKKLSLLAMTGGLLAGAGGVAPASVSAQAPSVDQLLNETVKKLVNTQTVHTKGEWKISNTLPSQEEGILIGGRFEANVDLDQASGFGSFDLGSFLGDYHLIASVKDGKLHGKENHEEEVRSLDIKTEVQEFQDSLKHLRSLDQFYTPEEIALYSEIYEVKELENGYELRLREDVDGKKVYRDHEPAWNLLSAAAVYGAYQSDHPTDTKEISTELIRYIFNEDAFEAFFASKPKFNYQVDKDFRLQSIEVDMVFTIEEGKTRHLNYLAGTYRIQGKITFDQYNEPVQSPRP